MHLEKKRNQEANPDIATLIIRGKKKIRSHKIVPINNFTGKLLLLQAINLGEEGLKQYQEKFTRKKLPLLAKGPEGF